METRTKTSYQTYLSDFLKFDIPVICPNCEKKAIVKPSEFTYSLSDQNSTKVICLNCGYSKKLLEKPVSIIYSEKNNKIIGRKYIIGDGIDPYFYLPLWYSINFDNHVLWAYNIEHLEFLKSHIEAKLRERNIQEISNQSIGSRLPKWMNTSKNREPLLKVLTELQNKK